MVLVIMTTLQRLQHQIEHVRNRTGLLYSALQLVEEAVNVADQALVIAASYSKSGQDSASEASAEPTSSTVRPASGAPPETASA